MNFLKNEIFLEGKCFILELPILTVPKDAKFKAYYNLFSCQRRRIYKITKYSFFILSYH